MMNPLVIALASAIVENTTTERTDAVRPAQELHEGIEDASAVMMPVVAEMMSLCTTRGQTTCMMDICAAMKNLTVLLTEPEIG